MGSERGRGVAEGTAASAQPAAPVAAVGKQALTVQAGEDTTSGPVQRKTGAGDAGPPPSGGGAPLAPDVRTRMERLFGASFSAVRVQQTSYAQAVGALAFTRGADIFFAPGRYDPHSPAGLELLGHELTHVVQQAQGRVPVTSEVGGAPSNDDVSLEAEADAAGAKVARGEAAHGGATAPDAPAHTGPVQAKSAASSAADADTAAGLPRMLPAEASTAVAPTAGGPPIQMAPLGKQAKKFIRFKIAIDKPMTREEFEAAADTQVFGRVLRGSWENVKDAYTPADSPVTVGYEESMVLSMRGQTSAAKGIDTDAATGKVAGADARTKTFDAGPASGEKTGILGEIDRRYYAATGAAPGTKIKPGEAGNAALWRSIRDEVLFQHQYIANLPDNVKAIIHTSITGKELTPADYDQLFRIGKKIEGLPPGAAADYASKITGTAADLTTLEAAVDHYAAERTARDAADADRTSVHNKLLGLDEVYKLYRQYSRQLITEAVSPMMKVTNIGLKKLGVPVQTADDVRDELEKQLPRYGFATIAAFGAYISRFKQGFEDGAVQITKDLLGKYAGKLYKEQERYKDPAVVKDLHGKLGGFRAQYQDFDKSSKRWHELQYRKDRGSLPDANEHVAQADIDDAAQKTAAAKAGAQASIKNLAHDYPIFAEDELPVDKRLDKTALAQATEAQLAGVLESHIADRNKVVVNARDQLSDNHERIYKLDKLMPAFYAGMGIAPGSIHDQIIQDKMHDDAITKIVGGILLAIVAVALTVVSMGTATPAIVAAGASMGAAGISAYMAIDEYKEYTAQHAMAEAGFADDPSVAWLVLSIVGAGVDMAAVVKAVRALAPAAKALEAGGEIKDFTKVVEALKKSKQLEERAAAAAENAAAARDAYKLAKADLGKALGKVYGGLGPFADPDVYRALVKMAAAQIRKGIHSLDAFISEIRAANAAKGLGELSAEQLMKAKEAFAAGETEAKVLEKLALKVPDSAQLTKLLDLIKDPARLHAVLEVLSPAELEAAIAGIRRPEALAHFLEHVGSESGAKMVKRWLGKGKLRLLDDFMDRMTAGAKELAETSGVHADSVIIDSNTVVAILADADGKTLGAGMNAGEVARVNWVKSLPPGTELRVGNVTVGESAVGRVTLHGGVKGLPITVLRDSDEYKGLLSVLESSGIGAKKGAADRAMVADAFFAKSEGGAVPKFATADNDVFTKLSKHADPRVVLNPGETLPAVRSSGFNVVINGRTLTVIPLR
jgi:hypothetical protein